ncbi:MAG: hypothetical protein ACPGJE_05285, partial [Wenzhouxiangellaceae bacterium]
MSIKIALRRLLPALLLASTAHAINPEQIAREALNHRAAEADNRLKRLYDAIEAGSLDPAESSLGERIAGLTALRD